MQQSYIYQVLGYEIFYPCLPEIGGSHFAGIMAVKFISITMRGEFIVFIWLINFNKLWFLKALKAFCKIKQIP